MHRFLSTNIVCSKMRTVLLERRSRKTVKFEEQIMFKDKSAFRFEYEYVRAK